MEIGPLSNDPRPSADKGDQNMGNKEAAAKSAAAPLTQDDVRISENARARLAAVTADAYRQFGPHIRREDIRQKSEYLDAPRPLDKNMSSTEKIDMLRERIEQGFYDRPEVKDEIARRLSDNGTTPPKDEKDLGQTD